MAVNVTMLVSALPDGVPQDERTIRYEDAGRSRYTYRVLDSGVLVVLKGIGVDNQIEVMYGPAAWESVQGDAVGSSGKS
ncbi:MULTISPECIES: hypothetical protein [unclassified Streptomyces]|uniref:hypothetical protein n=1 Tax=unclassified Streptomyces TaxID=2593676 RepID=UPI0036E055B6